MERHREQVAEDQIDLAAEPVSPVGTALGSSIENAHEHREAHMTRHRQNRPGQRHGQAIAEHIFHVFKGGEAQGHEHRVDDGVKAVVEVRLLPGAPVQEEKLCSLLHRCHHQEGQVVDIVGIVLADLPVQHHLSQRFQHDGRESRQNPLPHKACQQSHRLRLDLILPVDIAHEENGRQHRRQDIDRQHRENQIRYNRSEKEHRPTPFTSR